MQIKTGTWKTAAHTVVQELGFSELKLYSDPDDGSLDLALQGELAKRNVLDSTNPLLRTLQRAYTT